MGAFDNGINASDKEIGAYGNYDGNDNQGNTCGNWRQDMLLLLVGALCLNIIEQIMMAEELEVEVEEIKDQKNDGGSVGQQKNILVGVGTFGIFQCSVEGRGNDE